MDGFVRFFTFFWRWRLTCINQDYVALNEFVCRCFVAMDGFSQYFVDG